MKKRKIGIKVLKEDVESLLKTAIREKPTTAALQLMTTTNEFLEQFRANAYNHKQKSELKVSSLLIVHSMMKMKESPIKTLPELIISGHVQMFVELEKLSETICIGTESWLSKEVEIIDSTYQGRLVNGINTLLFSLMRHGLATVIRTAQKKKAEPIL